MKIFWNQNTIRWFRDASEYTGYNKKLAQILLDYIPHRNSLCDVGCGAGLIDIELSPHFNQITCVDIAPGAVESIRELAIQKQLPNIHAVCMDGKDYKESADTVIALFHGGADVFNTYYPLAKKQLIIVTHIGKRGSFGPEKYRTKHYSDVISTRNFLKEHNITYTYSEHSLEHGQPFSSLEDAILFMDVYGSRDMTPEEKREHLHSTLVHTNSTDFPFYLPNKKEMGIFVINR